MTTNPTETPPKIDPEVLDIQKKIYRELLIKQACVKRGSEFFPVTLEPYQFERHRLAQPFTNKDRAARRQYLEDQLLSDREPVNIPEWNRVNIFRRMYRKPFDAMTNLIRPLVGDQYSRYFRYTMPKITGMLLFSWFLWYHVKYHDNWEKHAKSLKSGAYRGSFWPGEPGYPDRWKEVDDFGMEGFNRRTAFLGEKLVTSGS
uniref:Hypotheticial protein n=1 Tax=Schistosoma japonicum TaxID=6182 RepID=C1LEQ6_SCHJA|nr:hypotheticial protein [Schistosoma japonicum]